MGVIRKLAGRRGFVGVCVCDDCSISQAVCMAENNPVGQYGNVQTKQKASNSQLVMPGSQHTSKF